MKKIIAAAVVLGLGVLARAATWTAGKGLQTAEMSVSTPAAVAVQVATGAGYITAVDVSSITNAGDFCDLFDSASVSGYSSSPSAYPAGTLAAPMVASVVATTGPATYSLPTSSPRPFYNGIVAWCKAAVHAIVIGTN